MTVHRWFAAKACPGNYLYYLHSQIAAEVNSLLDEEEDSEDMDIDKLIDNMSDEQAYRLLAKAERHQAKLPEPQWSVDEGHWLRATAAGIVDGTAPERAMRRDEVVAVLGRKELL